MTRLQRAVVFGTAAAIATFFASFGLAAADAPDWLILAAGAMCIAAAAYRTVEPNLRVRRRTTDGP